jgi:hypothetical protein
MPVTISGSGTITGIATGGLPDGSIAAGDLASTLDLTGKTVTLPSGTGGKVLQVVQAVKTDTQSVGNRTFVDITDLSVTITPTSSSSKFLIMYHIGMVGTDNSGPLVTRILRDSTDIGSGVSGTLNSNAGTYLASSTLAASSAGFYLDSPSTSSQIVYKLQMASDSTTAYVNRRAGDTFFRTSSTFTVMEVAG